MINDFRGQTFVFLGRSGAGKGEQSKFLQRFLKKQKIRFIYISTGELGRRLADERTIVSELVKSILKKGDFFPSWLAIHIWLSELEKKLVDNDSVIIFEGTPRKVVEAEMVDELMKRLRRPPSVPIFLDIDEREATRRLLARGRADDTPKVIKKRLTNFRKDVLPIVKHYGRRVIKISGMGTEREVWERIHQRMMKN